VKAIGIVRDVDQLGRVVIPSELRSTLGIGTNTPLEIFVDGDMIVMRKYYPGCVFCGERGAFMLAGKQVCKACAAKLVAASAAGGRSGQ